MNSKYSYSGTLYSVILILIMYEISGCKKFVQVDPPTTSLVTGSVFDNSDAATSAVTNIYTQMANNSESYLVSQMSGLLSDELGNASVNPSYIRYYTNSMDPADGPGRWLYAYNYIYQANAVLTGLKNNGGVVLPAIQNQLLGESLFLRAFWHFYLANTYGDVPLVLTTDYTKNSIISRTPKNQVYSQVIADLNEAEQMLSTNYVDASDTVTTIERVRPNKAVVQAFLARVYLYEGKYDSAEYEATQVINNTSYSLCTNLSGANSVFLKNSSEAIWQISTPEPASFDTYDGEGYVLFGAPSTGSINCNVISSELFNSFEVGDLRKSNWIGAYTTTTSPIVTYYYPFKYQSNNTSSSSSDDVSEYVMVLRLAEQFLIRAEARAQQGFTTDATNDLNVIRQRAGLSAYAGSSDVPSLLSAILHERQVELFTEWGHRWYDLERTGNLNGVMGGANGVCFQKGGAWSPTATLYPIPLSEILVDYNLHQNPGY